MCLVCRGLFITEIRWVLFGWSVKMGRLVKKYCETSLILKIFIALVLGTISGIFFQKFSFLSMFGTFFVNTMKAVSPILVFMLVCSSISQANEGLGKRFKSVVFLYIFNMLCASFIAVLGSFLFPVTLKFTESPTTYLHTPCGVSEILNNLLNNIIKNPIASLCEGNYLGILFWAIILGFCLKKVAKENTINTISDLCDAISRSVKGIIQLAPFGVFGLVYKSVSDGGITVFRDYGRLLLLLVGCMLFSALVVNPIIVWVILRRNPYPLVLRCLRESGVTAFFTRSSAANIPVNMDLCKKLGLDKDFYSVSIPLGATMNTNGAAITIATMTLATCHTLGVVVDFPTAIMLSMLAVVSATGSSGVTGGSLLLVPMACSLFGISNDYAMQTVGIGFIIGVVQDSVETALNSSGDAIFTATAEYKERMQNGLEVNFLGDFSKK